MKNDAVVLIIDDDKGIRDTLKGVFEDEGYSVYSVGSGEEGLRLSRAVAPDLILLDIWMPELDGLQTLQHLKSEGGDGIVIMMSGHGNIETAVKATKMGAYDFVEKPISLEKLLLLVQHGLQARRLAKENSTLKKQVQVQRNILGTSPSISKLRERIQQVAPTTGSVLITGENGTGKELVAHAIHFGSTRSARAFVEVNCAAIPDELIESELFGYEKGAFTGALQSKKGKFDLANGGTLFLDEIGDMSLKTQAKILRILQEQKFERVGGTQTLQVDVRIVAATNKDLKQEILKGNFREDLFYRLNVVPFHVPALRERKEDIPLLVEFFLHEFSQQHGKPERHLSAGAVSALLSYPWPGNVRELRNLIERMVILQRDLDPTEILASEVLENLGLPREGENAPAAAEEQLHQGLETEGSSIIASGTGRSLRDARAEFEKEFILKILEENEGNVTRTANALGLERTHLHRKIRSYGIEL